MTHAECRYNESCPRQWMASTRGHTVREARPRVYSPPTSPSQGPWLEQNHLLCSSFFSRVLPELRDLSAELYAESCQFKGVPPFGGVCMVECERHLLLKETKKKERKRNYRLAKIQLPNASITVITSEFSRTSVCLDKPF